MCPWPMRPPVAGAPAGDPPGSLGIGRGSNHMAARPGPARPGPGAFQGLVRTISLKAFWVQQQHGAWPPEAGAAAPQDTGGGSTGWREALPADLGPRGAGRSPLDHNAPGTPGNGPLKPPPRLEVRGRF